MTAPSTMMPKSMAPMLSRFALIPRTRRYANEAASDSGITVATMSDARTDSVNANRTRVTRSAPSIKVVKDGLERRIDEDRAVVERGYLHSFRQNVPSDLVQALAEQRQHHRRVLAAPHEHDALHGVVLVSPRDHSLPRLVPLAHLGHVADEHGNALVLLHHGLRDVVDAREDPDAANDEHLAAALDVAAGRVAAGLGDGGKDVVQRDAERRQTHRIGLDVDLLHEPAVGHDVGDARRRGGARGAPPSLAASGASSDRRRRP